MLVHEIADRILEAVDGPTLLAFDDLQWADELSLEVVGELARRAADRPLLVLGGYRLGELPSGSIHREWRARLLSQRLAEEVRLSPLTYDETALVTTLILGTGPAGAARGGRRGVRADGRRPAPHRGAARGARRRGAVRRAGDPGGARPGDDRGRGARARTPASPRTPRPSRAPAPSSAAASSRRSPPGSSTGRSATSTSRSRSSSTRRSSTRSTSSIGASTTSATSSSGTPCTSTVQAGELRRLHARAAEFGGLIEGASEIHASVHFERAGMHREAYRAALAGARAASGRDQPARGVRAVRAGGRQRPRGPAARRARGRCTPSTATPRSPSTTCRSSRSSARLARRYHLEAGPAGRGGVRPRRASPGSPGATCGRWRSGGALLAEADGGARGAARRRPSATASCPRCGRSRRSSSSTRSGSTPRRRCSTRRAGCGSHRTIPTRPTSTTSAAELDVARGTTSTPGLDTMLEIARRARSARLESTGVTAFRWLAAIAVRVMDYPTAAIALGEGLRYADEIEQSYCRHVLAATSAHVAWAAGRWDEAVHVAGPGARRAGQPARDARLARRPRVRRVRPGRGRSGAGAARGLAGDRPGERRGRARAAGDSGASPRPRSWRASPASAIDAVRGRPGPRARHRRAGAAGAVRRDGRARGAGGAPPRRRGAVAGAA